MGDIADEHANWLIERWWGPGHHGVGRRPRSRRRFVSCMHCGADRLEWKHLDGRWTLVHPKGQKVHRCDPDAVNRKITNLLDDLAP